MTGRPDVVRGDDGLRRCRWGAAPPDYARYHDDEWGRPVSTTCASTRSSASRASSRGSRGSPSCASATGSGRAFAGFDPATVARFGDARRPPPARPTPASCATGARSRRRSRTPGPRSPRRTTRVAALVWSFEPSGRREARLGAPLAANAGDKVAAATTHAHAATAAAPVNVVRLPTDLPGPIGKRGPQRVKVDLETIEVTGQLADGTTYHYWTFNGKVPGPFVRVRVGDTVEVKLKNHDDSVDDAQRRLPCRHRPGRRRQGDRGGARRDQRLHLQGAQSRPLRLPLRDADGRPSTSPTACTA